MRRLKLLASGVALAALVPQTVYAQAPAAPRDDSSGRNDKVADIIVTAQKREQNLQDVPIAVSAIGTEQIQNNRIETVNDISSFAPNVIALPQIGGNQIASFSIRGVLASNTAPESDNPVSIYVDGVYLGRAVGAQFDFADIERIEVLRGPQGTLFGRNSTGGAISVLTSNPTGKLGGYIQGSLGNYDLRRFKVRLDTPEWNGFSAQFNFYKKKRDGDVRNLGAGTTWDFTDATNGRRTVYRAADTLGAEDTTAFRAALRYNPNSDIDISYKYDRTLNKGSPGATASILPPAQSQGTVNFLNGLFGRGTVSGDFTEYDKRPKAVNNWFTSNSHQLVQGHTLTATFALSDTVTVKNIAALRKQKGNSINQLDGLGGLIDDDTGDPLLAVALASETDFKQVTEELQLNVSTNSFEMVGGLFYFNEKLVSGGPGIPQVFFFQTVPNFVISAPSVPDNRFQSTSYAVFAQATLHLTDKLDVTLGGRETFDRKVAVYNNGPILGNFHYRKQRFNYLANVTYRPNADVMVYASTSTGYLSGGTSNGTPFSPEEVTNYEIGAKMDLLDRRLRVNAAAFYLDYRGLQFTVFPSGSAIILNAGKSRTWGAEVEATVIPFDGLTLTGNFGYTSFKYLELDPSVGDPRTFLEAYRPKWTASLAATYTLPTMSNGAALSFGADTQAAAKQFTAVDPAFRDQAQAPERWLVNARATLTDLPIGSLKATVQAWGKNLTNNRSITFSGNVGPTLASYFLPARTYGVDLTLKF